MDIQSLGAFLHTSRCEALWKAVSPGTGPWDDRELMSAFHDEQLHRLHFLVREEAGQPTGLMPLVHDIENDRHLLYGGSNRDRKNLGKLLNVETIQEACRRKVGEINCMTGMQWKAAWDMESETCRTMRKPPLAE